MAQILCNDWRWMPVRKGDRVQTTIAGFALGEVGIAEYMREDGKLAIYGRDAGKVYKFVEPSKIVNLDVSVMKLKIEIETNADIDTPEVAKMLLDAAYTHAVSEMQSAFEQWPGVSHKSSFVVDNPTSIELDGEWFNVHYKVGVSKS